MSATARVRLIDGSDARDVVLSFGDELPRRGDFISLLDDRREVKARYQVTGVQRCVVETDGVPRIDGYEVETFVTAAKV